MTALLFIVGSVSLLSLWAARALTRPLSAFATARPPLASISLTTPSARAFDGSRPSTVTP